MQLNPAAFAAHLEGLAEPFLFRKSYACPCLNPASGSPKANCPRCFGKGLLWTAPKEVTAAVASSNVQLAWARMGNYQTGDLVVSIPNTSGLYYIAMNDRVTALTSTDQRSTVLVRGAPNERLVGAVKSVHRVFWLDANSLDVEGGIPVVDAVTGRLAWPAGGEPPAGKPYSIDYVRYAEYFCLSSFSNDRAKHGGLPLPRKMVLRFFDLLGRSANGNA